MKTKVTLEFDTPGAAAAFLAGVGTAALPNASGSSPAARTAPQPPPTAPTGTAPPPPPSAPAGAPPPGPVAPPPAPPPQQPPPPPPAANGMATQAQVLAAMGEYAKTHKAAGVKNVLSQCQLDKVTTATPEQLTWLLAAFQSNQPYQLRTV